MALHLRRQVLLVEFGPGRHGAHLFQHRRMVRRDLVGGGGAKGTGHGFLLGNLQHGKGLHGGVGGLVGGDPAAEQGKVAAHQDRLHLCIGRGLGKRHPGDRHDGGHGTGGEKGSALHRGVSCWVARDCRTL